MLRHIYRGMGVLLLAVLLAVLTAAPVLAFDGRTGDTVTVASGEVVDDDLYLAGSTIIINGTVNGDVLAVGSQIIVNGRINGSLIAAGGNIVVSGEVTRAVRIAGGTLEIKGNVGSDVVAAGGTLSLTSAANVGNDLVLGAGQVNVYSPVSGDIIGGGGDIILSSTVGGNVKLGVDNLTLLSTASIEGNLLYTGENEADIQPGARIAGTTAYKPAPMDQKPEGGMGIVGKIVGFLMALALGVVLVLIAPRRLTALTEAVRTKPWHSLGWGAVLLVVTPIAAVIICITVVGVPIGLIALALYGIAIYISQIFIGLLLGRLILGAFKGVGPVEKRGILIGALALGLFILTLLKMIPYAGFFIGLAAVLFGLGAILVSEKQLREE
ncbi:MAG: hypothetical protein HQ588_05395 [Deltaproteobacteria bacterium]|nr:hypothetical protein [Deltaproteobacteria bacterium]